MIKTFLNVGFISVLLSPSITFSSDSSSSQYDCALQGPASVNIRKEYFCLYEEILSPPYKQWWYVDYLFRSNEESEQHLIYVHGDGKSGDFFGTLEMSCATESATWVAADGFVQINQVPSEIYGRLGLAFCGSAVSLGSVEVRWD